MVSDNEIAAHIVKWLNGEKPGPLVLEIHPTYRCNLDCIFCSFARARQKNRMDYSVELSTERWLEIVEMAASSHVREIRVCGGGEPTFYNERFTKIMQKIKKLGMTGCLTTNGTILDKGTIQSMVESGWDVIEFSLNGASKETDDFLRGSSGVFERTVSAISDFNQFKIKSKSKKPGMKLNTVVTNKNYMEIPELIELAHQLGIWEIVLLKLNPDSPNGELLELDESHSPNLIRIIEKADRTCIRWGMRLTADSIIKCPNNKEKLCHPNTGPRKGTCFTKASCYEPWYYMQIMNDGSVSPCCNGFCSKNTWTLYNYPLMELWLNSRHLNSIRGGILNGRSPIKCSGCSLGLQRSVGIGRILKDKLDKDG